MLKDLFAYTVQEILEAELDDHLGYSRIIRIKKLKTVEMDIEAKKSYLILEK